MAGGQEAFSKCDVGLHVPARADSEYRGGALGSSTSVSLDSDDEHPSSSLRQSCCVAQWM